MKSILQLFILVSVLFITACAIESSEMGAGTPSMLSDDATFREHLIVQYLALAKSEQDEELDYKAAQNYMEKVERLEKGRMARLDNYENYSLVDKDVSEIKQAQDDLVYALKHYRLNENRKALAVAHSRYDCWLDQAEEGDGTGNCRVEFKRAMNNLAYPVGNTESFDSTGWSVFELGF